MVTLRGDVTARPDKPADLYERISKVRGVQAIVDEIEVLSPGIHDEQLRHRIARALFGHPQFDRYLGLAPRMSIIVPERLRDAQGASSSTRRTGFSRRASPAGPTGWSG